jgi:hypothetical protein
MEENDCYYGKKVVVEEVEIQTNVESRMIISARKLRDENYVEAQG